MKNRGLILFVSQLLIYSCVSTPPNTQVASPKPSITTSPNISTGSTIVPSLTSSPQINPSITITIPSPNISNTAPNFNFNEIQEIRIFSEDDGNMMSKEFITNKFPYSRNGEYNILKNESKKFKAEIIDKNGLVSSENIRWFSSDSNIVVVDNNGTISAGTKLGKATIKAVSNNNEKLTTMFEVNLLDSLDSTISTPLICEAKIEKIILPRYVSIYSDDYYSTLPSGQSGYAYSSYERVLLKGFVYDINGVPIEGAIVNAKSIDPGANWVGETTTTNKDGEYRFRYPRTGYRIAVTVEKKGWSTRIKSDTMKFNTNCDQDINVINFKDSFAIQDEPEVTMLKINGRTVNSSSNSDIFITGSNAPKNSKPNPTNLDVGRQLTSENIGNVPSLISVNSSTLEVEMTFSEPVNKEDVENYFKITSQTGFDNRNSSFIIDKNSQAVSFEWSADQTIVKFKVNKPLLSNRGGDEGRYLIDFSQAFRDKTGKPAIDRRYFRFSLNQINDFAVFSVRNDEEAPKLFSITAKDGINGDNDTIELRYSEPMDVIENKSYTSELADRLAPSNQLRKLWYRDANNAKANAISQTGSINDNNATLIGYLSNSDSDINQFNSSYMIGRILKSDIDNGTPKVSLLGKKDRTPNIIPVKANTTANELLKNAYIIGSNVIIELSTDSFDKDDKVILTVTGRTHGSYVDRNRTPNVNEDLTVNRLGNAVDYSQIYDPAGRLIDTGNSTTSANIDVDNGQRVSIVE